MDILTLLLVILLFIIAILLILIVLVQDDQGDAMGGLFGGSSSSAFGSRSGNILTRTTSILGTLFVAIILGMVFIFNSPETIVESDIDFNPEIETQVAPEGETTIDGNITVPSETDESDN